MTRIFLLLTIFWIRIALGNADQEIEFILNAQNPPIGVVFEIVEGKQDALQSAIPKINSHIEKLRSRLPDLKIAIVSHGVEEFSLLAENSEKYGDVHNSVQRLVRQEIPVHVCGTHASWRNKTANDFPTYVDVVEAGPKKIREYVKQGFVPIQISN